MISVNYSDLDQILTDALAAFEYAGKNFEKLKNRQVSHVLYGPETYGIGVAAPSNITKIRERRLARATRRKNYSVYELDQNYQLLCNRDVENGKIHCSYYHFDLGNIRYARSFFEDTNLFYNDVVFCVKQDGNTPIFYASASPCMLHVEFYEMLHENNVLVTDYFYYPTREFSEKGIPISRDAPFGAPNSPVDVSCYETTLPNIDFAQWFVP